MLTGAIQYVVLTFNMAQCPSRCSLFIVFWVNDQKVLNDNSLLGSLCFNLARSSTSFELQREMATVWVKSPPPFLLHTILRNVAVSQFRVCILQMSIWRANMSQCCMKAPPNAAHKCVLLFPCFWRMHGYYPSWPHISQDSLHSQRR